MQEAARRIAKIAIESKLPLVEGERLFPPSIDELSLIHRSPFARAEEYVASFKPELMDAVFSWCNGAKFSEICKASSSLSLSLIVFAADSLRRFPFPSPPR